MKKITKAKMTEAKKALARLGEKYRNGLSSRPPQGPTDTVFWEFVSRLNEEDLETGLEGTAYMTKLKLDTYKIVARAIEEGILFGYQRAHKHVDAPDEAVIKECIYDEIMIQLCEVVQWDDYEEKK